MRETAKISHTAARILQTVSSGFVYLFDVMEVTGLPNGTVYPALRRLEGAELIAGESEDPKKAARENRPERRYYRLTGFGKQTLAAALQRYPLLRRTSPEEKGAS